MYLCAMDALSDNVLFISHNFTSYLPKFYRLFPTILSWTSGKLILKSTKDGVSCIICLYTYLTLMLPADDLVKTLTNLLTDLQNLTW